MDSTALLGMDIGFLYGAYMMAPCAASWAQSHGVIGWAWRTWRGPRKLP